MSFPNVQRISYSTCSIHDRENDTVINNVIQNNENWNIIDAKTGMEGFDGKGKRTLTVTPFTAATNGFFVGLIERAE